MEPSPGRDGRDFLAHEPGRNAGHAILNSNSLKAVESWEQGVRRPREATLKLLIIAHQHPEILLPHSPGGTA